MPDDYGYGAGNPVGPPPSAPAPSPAETTLATAQGANAPDSATGASLPLTTPTAASRIPLNPTDQQLEDIRRASVGSRIYHGILGALGGKYDTQFIPTPNGVMKTQTASTPGSQWKRIIAGAISGVGAAEAGGGTGPGATARGLGLGIQAGTKTAQEAYKQQEEEANTQFEQQQKAALNNAQTAMLGQQRLNLQWELTRGQQTATQADIDRSNTFGQVIASGGDGTRDVGHFPDLASAIKATQADPTLHDQHAGGRLVYNDVIDPSGKHNGVQAYYVTPDLMNSKVPFAVTLPLRQTKNGKVTWTDVTFDKDKITYDQYFKLSTAQGNDEKADQLKDVEIEAKRQETEASKQKLPAEVGLIRAQAHEAEAGAGAKEATEELTRGKIIPFGNPIAVTDPNFPPAQNFPAGTTGIVSNKVGQVPAASQRNADLARLIEHNTQHALQIINANPALLGKVMGRFSSFKEWAGTNDGNLSSLHQDIENIAMPTVGIHGTRSQKLVDNEGKILFNNFKNGPDAVKATLLANLESARTYLQEEQNFLHYGTATGPDRRLQLQAPGATATGQSQQIKQGTADLTKLPESATAYPGAIGHVPVAGPNGQPIGEYWVSGDGVPMAKFTGK